MSTITAIWLSKGAYSSQSSNLWRLIISASLFHLWWDDCPRARFTFSRSFTAPFSPVPKTTLRFNGVVWPCAFHAASWLFPAHTMGGAPSSPVWKIGYMTTIWKDKLTNERNFYAWIHIALSSLITADCTWSSDVSYWFRWDCHSSALCFFNGLSIFLCFCSHGQFLEVEFPRLFSSRNRLRKSGCKERRRACTSRDRRGGGNRFAFEHGHAKRRDRVTTRTRSW